MNYHGFELHITVLWKTGHQFRVTSWKNKSMEVMESLGCFLVSLLAFQPSKIIGCIYLRNGASRKYELCKHSSAVALFLGSYINRKFSNLKPAPLNKGNLSLMLLYGWCFRFTFWTAGKLENSGQIASLGDPKRSIIKSNCWISPLPGSNGLWSNNSPNIQPVKQKFGTFVYLVLNQCNKLFQ